MNKSGFSHPKAIHQFMLDNWSSTTKLMFAALMAALASVLQSAGGLLPGVGYFLSPFSTAPILLGAIISFRLGVLTYLLTIILLLLLEPSELVIFPFTTGLLGLGLGWAFLTLNRRWSTLIVNGFLLFIGVCIPLYGFGFPVFGPALSSSFNLISILMIYGFSLLYSWIWLEFALFLLRKVKAILRLK